MDEVDKDSRLIRARPEQTNASIPFPLNRRLDKLVALLQADGKGVYRKDVLAALVLDAPSDLKALSDVYERYRLATVRDAALGTGDESDPDILVLGSRRPGRRPAG